MKSSFSLLALFCATCSIVVLASDEVGKRSSPLFFMSPAARMRQLEEELIAEEYPETERKRILMTAFPRTGRSGLRTWSENSNVNPYLVNYDRINEEY